MTTDQTSPRVDRRIPWLVVLPFLLITGVMLIGRSKYDSAARIQGSFDLPREVKTVKIVTDVGNVDVLIGTGGKLSFEGKTFLATGSQEQLDAALAVPFTMESTPSEDPTVFVLRVSPMPAGFRRLPPRKNDEQQEEASPRLLLRQMDVRLRVPVQLAVDVEAGQGSIRIDTRQAATSVQVEKGDLMLQHLAGPLTVRSGGGDTIVDQHRGPLDVQCAGKARITMAEVTGPVDVVNSLGELDFLLPAHSSVAVEARSVTGNVRNGLGFPTEQQGGGSAAKGKLGGGEQPVRLVARQGTLTIKSTGR